MKSLADPTKLKPLDKKEGLLQVIIETPAGSRNKFAFDPEQEIFAVKKVLPAGMVFPYDFGFLPQTIAPDGDPIDVLLLMDEPAYPGCVVRSRLINVRKFKDLPGKWIQELEQFFVNYHNLEGKKYRLLGCKGADIAFDLIRRARKAA